MYSLCTVWYDGCHGWLAAGAWIFGNADDCIIDWCLRAPVAVDIYIFPYVRSVSYSTFSVSDVSCELDYHNMCTRDMLCDCATEVKQAAEISERDEVRHKNILHA